MSNNNFFIGLNVFYNTRLKLSVINPNYLKNDSPNTFAGSVFKYLYHRLKYLYHHLKYLYHHFKYLYHRFKYLYHHFKYLYHHF